MKKLIFAVFAFGLAIVARADTLKQVQGSSFTAPGITFAQLTSLLSQTNITGTYCSDCKQTNPCTSGGTGAKASYANGIWSCTVGGVGGSSDRILNVMNFGAKGDGTTNDRAAINAALAACTGVNNEVFFPCGVYETDATALSVPTTCKTISGSGECSIIDVPLNTTFTNGGDPIFLLAASPGALIRNLAIRTPVTLGNANQPVAVKPNVSTRVVVRNVHFIGNSTMFAGMLSDGCVECTVQDSTADDIAQSAFASMSTTRSADRTKFVNNRVDHVVVGDAFLCAANGANLNKRCKIQDNYWSRVFNTGAECDGAPNAGVQNTDCLIANNICDATASPFSAACFILRNTVNSKVSNNIGSFAGIGLGTACMWDWATESNNSHNTFENNTCKLTNTHGAALQILTAGANTISHESYIGNTWQSFAGADTPTVAVGSAINNSSFIGEKIIGDPGQDGLSIICGAGSHCSELFITSVDITNANNGATLTNLDNSTITNNFIHDNAAFGINRTGGSGDQEYLNAFFNNVSGGSNVAETLAIANGGLFSVTGGSLPTATFADGTHCGAAGVITPRSTNNSGQITMGTTVNTTVCPITFATGAGIAPVNAPFCVVQDQTNPAHVTSYFNTNAILTINGATLQNDVVNWWCGGKG